MKMIGCLGREGIDAGDGGARKRHPERAARDSYEQTFGQRRTQNARARRAQGRADRGFAGAPSSARQQQVRDVGAGDQQHKHRGGLQNEHGAPCCRAHVFHRNRKHGRAESGIEPWIFALKLAHQTGQLHTRAFDRNAVEQTPKDVVAARFARDRRGEIGRGGQPNVG